MSILSEFIEIFINTKNSYNKYKKKGYNPEIGKSILVKICDIPKSCRLKISVSCDNCGDAFEIDYRSYNLNPEYPNVLCTKCHRKKIEDRYFEKYGVRNPMQLKENKEKQENTMIKKYGKSKPMQVDFIKDKYEKTCLEKYGTRYAIDNEDVRNKALTTNIEKYGVKYPFNSKDIRDKALETLSNKYYVSKSPFENKDIINKTKKTMIDRYGVDNPSKYEKFIKKSLDTKRMKYGKVLFAKSTSRQQILVCNILDGKLNTSIGKYVPDIIFDEKFICEYDGRGHDLGVRLGKISRDDFIENEINRENFLIDSGYKILRIINNNDREFNDNKIIEIKNIALEYFKKGISVFKYDLDTDKYSYR